MTNNSLGITTQGKGKAADLTYLEVIQMCNTILETVELAKTYISASILRFVID